MRDHLSMRLSDRKRRWVQSLVAACCTLQVALCMNPHGASAAGLNLPLPARDTLPPVNKDSLPVAADSTVTNEVVRVFDKRQSPAAFTNADTLNVKQVALYPYTSLQQSVKGNIRGLYVQEPSGEPGTEQFMYIRGLAMPLLSKQDVYQVQPAVYLNGIPLISDNSMVFDVQVNDKNRLGPAINLLNIINLDNVQSIDVYKDAAAIGLFGPRAANGVINIITKTPTFGKRKISINSYFGVNLYDPVFTTNGQYENRARKPYYDKYATTADSLAFPPYLRDSSNAAYYGNANWTDLYFQNTTSHGINAAISGGSERANFRFFADKTTANGIADNTRLDKYNANFLVNMAPKEWLMGSALINATRLDRNRNTSMVDRYIETAYVPDITSPLAPNKDAYGLYLRELDKGFDKNHLNSIQGSFSLMFHVKNLRYTTRLLFDYNESDRDIFYPSTLMDGANYVSNYYGNNQRVGFQNTVDYDWQPAAQHKFSFEAGQMYQSDNFRYNYQRAYNGASDRIKVNVVESNPDAGNYLAPLYYANQLVYRFIDGQKTRLLSFHGNVKYVYNNYLRLSLTLRNDGSSLINPAHRWLLSPSAGIEWDVKEHLLPAMTRVSDLTLHASYGRIGRLPGDERFAAGPQYKVDMGWTGNRNAASYAGVAGLSRPYSFGWVGENIPWATTDIFTLGANFSLYDHRVRINGDYYNKNDRNMLAPMPAVAESGYSSIYENGMLVNNSGVEATLAVDLVRTKKFTWTPEITASYNVNTLKALPGGAKSLTIGDRHFEVGQAVDMFWLYQNEGIYNTNAEVPVNSKTGSPLSFKGTAFEAGDAKWRDVNGDFTVDDKDKVLTGHSMPTVFGNISNTLRYGKLDLSFSLYYALGQSILNSKTATRLDFANHDGQTDLGSVKDITYWQHNEDMKTYPIYNPWSATIPFRADQDLFLEKASFVKLRTVSLGYDFAATKLLKKIAPTITRCYFYATANNILTFTGYTGGDPELTYYNGYDNGYTIPVPKTYTVGLKLDL
ncbi:SusC/RagA family TonB-linked outer membrane protein [Chitinophaga sp. sic0106]|uniref:SusC/RagA family TonB-linked outer membrane protein n=1 Tax=Chitinophaga sp. sic0106 TaxID=2854785 RepID=UPI001C448AB9|nr:SusC/RagA family TonB-linked outer membrane protein [Chitinophaga sp. sic0106]MBV7531412.1 SusC/RagA family TonB-linked outer membrane protein [Chitinophaga sp. sic0106]